MGEGVGVEDGVRGGRLLILGFQGGRVFEQIRYFCI